jgi:hypothetical protein
MSTLALVLAPIATLWAILTLAVLVLDGRARRDERLRLEVRDWQEKVDAMRRLHDEDGAA